ncbi:carboxypeptidase-like regulatory domain-containing protein [Hymenobacter sp. BRD67]|uniref:carboxypeptidase-like regulatory domain-containing protein n=1 Tax=Hymenobacter sp. BRD67 TaxID=2675877 RepID=UPI0015645329|nr:carboxypeptidase-like regulatory domain-containing protein [Hymenobacter sp. BRD67]QKG51802.1 carboxypeptidase regulatory-like domain-containing protein [Hymenobacter sp. BRD67]
MLRACRAGGQKAGTPKSAASLATPAAAPPVAEALAPQTVQLKGIVLKADGQPCAGASVYPAGAPRQLVVTDAKGTFTLPVPASMPVSLRVEYFGEGSSRVEVPAKAATEPLHITLGQ